MVACRSAADAIGQCFLNLSRKTSAQWVLVGDIKACFDEIDHRWLMEHVGTDKRLLQQWLAAGYIEKGPSTIRRQAHHKGANEKLFICPLMNIYSLCKVDPLGRAVAYRVGKFALHNEVKQNVTKCSTKREDRRPLSSEVNC